MNNLKKSKIAIVGVSSNKEKYGYKIFKDLLEKKYNIVGINPKIKVVLKQKIFSSLSSLEFKPDLVIIVVPPKIALIILKECSKLNIKNVWLQPGAESDEAIEFSKKNNINLTANVCFMVKEELW